MSTSLGWLKELAVSRQSTACIPDSFRIWLDSHNINAERDTMKGLSQTQLAQAGSLWSLITVT